MMQLNDGRKHSQVGHHTNELDTISCAAAAEDVSHGRATLGTHCVVTKLIMANEAFWNSVYKSLKLKITAYIFLHVSIH